MNIAHLLSVPFSGFGLHKGFRGNTWLKRRLMIFRQFVLPSLMSQTKKEFLLHFCFRAEEKKNPLVVEFMRHMNMMRGMTPIFTFHGVMLYDDKYTSAVASARLMHTLKGTLPELEPYVKHADWIIQTCQPSDDILHTDAVRQIQSVKPIEHGAVGWTKGYIMDYGSLRLAEYNPDTLPPFASLFFRKENFLNPAKHFVYIGPYKSHEHVKDSFTFLPFENRGFIVGTHGQNISTTFEVPYKGQELTATDGLLLDFGLWPAEPLKLPPSLPVRLRAIVNRLPAPLYHVIKTLYHIVCNLKR